ncbi:MAG: DUF2285 domain-containing protein, partial [Pseudomonadota bacterium]
LRKIAPDDAFITAYDREHMAIYARLVSAYDAGADWIDTATLILGLDVMADEAAAFVCFRSHTERALWVATKGYRQALAEAGLGSSG